MPRKVDDDVSSSDGSSDDVSSSESGSGSESSSGESSSSEEETPKMGSAQGSAPPPTAVQNKPHDEEFAVEAGDSSKGPVPVPSNSGAPAPSALAPTPSASGVDSTKIANDKHDEEFAVENSSGSVGGGAPGGGGAPVQRKTSSSNVKPSISGSIKNDPNDEAFDVENDMTSDEDSDEDDDDQDNSPPQRTTGKSGSQILKNDKEDEAFDVDSPQRGGAAPTSSAAAAPQQIQRPAAATQKQPAPVPGDDDSDDDEASESDATTDEGSSDEEEGSAPRMGPGNATLQTTTATTAGTNVEYNPADYAFLDGKVSREVRDLFSHIAAYQPTTIECPAKLRPFIPEYIPCVGDIDTFCKVPRPDEKPDNFGLTVVDEPSCDQSNPFVVKIALRHQSSKGSNLSEGGNVAMVDEAHLHPQQIDKWISDIKKVSKQLPTVTYTKPMPQIEQLMQIWPKDFEDMLNSDVAFPSSGIELDIEQYVRILCAILDIPTYTNLVESLHVMFTLYLEFRANQHFTHA